MAASVMLAAVVISCPCRSREKPVIKCKKMTFQYEGAAKPQLKDVTLKANMAARVGVLGPNGAGKSTLIKVITGAWPPPRLCRARPAAQLVSTRTCSTRAMECSPAVPALFLKPSRAVVTARSGTPAMRKGHIGLAFTGEAPLRAFSTRRVLCWPCRSRQGEGRVWAWLFR